MCGELHVRGQASWLQMVYRNLLANAVRHAPPHSTIEVSARAFGGRWCAAPSPIADPVCLLERGSTSSRSSCNTAIAPAPGASGSTCAAASSNCMADESESPVDVAAARSSGSTARSRPLRRRSASCRVGLERPSRTRDVGRSCPAAPRDLLCGERRIRRTRPVLAVARERLLCASGCCARSGVSRRVRPGETAARAVSVVRTPRARRSRSRRCRASARARRGRCKSGCVGAPDPRRQLPGG